jgi:hypothetical protein
MIETLENLNEAMDAFLKRSPEKFMHIMMLQAEISEDNFERMKDILRVVCVAANAKTNNTDEARLIRRHGVDINALGGFQAMQVVYMVMRDFMCEPYSDTHKALRVIDFLWGGIGDWRS